MKFTVSRATAERFPAVVDLYHGNAVHDFAKAKAFGVVGVIHKASQGSHMVDHAYATRRKLAYDQGLAWGAYHFLDSSDPEAQAASFLSVAAPDATTLLALDWERTRPAPGLSTARQFLQAVESKVGRQPVLYSGDVAKEQIKGKDAYLGGHRLWLPEYGSAWHVQESWSTPWLWQYGDRASVPGLDRFADVSVPVEPATLQEMLASWA